MTSKEFVIWMRGFMEACNDLTATPQQWDKIRDELARIKDHDHNPEEEIDDWYSVSDKIPGQPRSPYQPPYFTGDTSGWSTLTVPSSSTISFSTSSGNIAYVAWNDKMGCWHYTNSTLGVPVPEETKKQLLD